MSEYVQHIRDRFDGLPTWAKIVTGSIALGVGAGITAYMSGSGKRTGLMKQDWKPGVVYLFQFPPVKDLPNLSPYALKLETCLRMKNIPFEAVDCDPMKTRSKEGTLPFIELAGKEYHDSGFIMHELVKVFDVKEPYDKSPADRGVARAFEQMMENTTVWTYAMLRYGELRDQLFSEKVFGKPIPLQWRFFLWLMGGSNAMKTKLYHHGIGRHTREEIIEIGMRDLRAISAYLGKKDYLFGDEPSAADATMFGNLAQIVYLPLQTPHLELIQKECTNLKAYCDRIRDKCFPDWSEIYNKRKPFM